jgi:uncharacterized protein
MQWPLVLAGLALGVASTPHCAVMCSAPCAALTGAGPRAAGGFHAGRVIGYAAGGALAASGVAALGAWSQATPALRPLWTLLHLAFLALGVWWLATGRPPAAMRRDGAVPIAFVGRRHPTVRASAAGLAWVAWPCATLQAALLLAALANDAAGGALVMAAFALGSMPGLAAAPWAWARWRAGRGRGGGEGVGVGGRGGGHRERAGGGAAFAPQRVAALGYRIAGASLVIASGWALTHGVWLRFLAWCAA